MNGKSDNQYNDIINLPHPVSTKHPQMPRENRAAQFSPFAALTGHEAAIKETARLTDRKIELDDDEKLVLDEKFGILMEHFNLNPEVTITYYEPDDKKAGGSYRTVTGIVRKVDNFKRVVIMMDGTKIDIENVFALDGDLFDKIEF